MMNSNMLNDRAHTCTFTGHHPERLSFPESDVIAWLEKEIRVAISNGYETFISGMQRGVDLWAAEIVLRLHDAGENVHLIAATPFKGMETRWDEEWQRRYREVIKKADEIVFVSAKPCRAAFFQRNHYMVDHASYLLAVYSGGGGGTLETMNYAKKKEIEVLEYKNH